MDCALEYFNSASRRLTLQINAIHSLAHHKNTDDVNKIFFNCKRNDSTFFVISDTQSGTDIITGRATKRKYAEAFTIIDDGFGVPQCYFW